MSGETEADVSAWTIDSLRYHLEQIAADLDKRHEQRFVAQERALENALTARDKEVAAALAAQEKFAEAARQAQEKAIDKAESAAEKRFESVNEFRGQLADQASLFLNRDEYRAAHEALKEKVDIGSDRLAERMLTLEGRVNLMTGQQTGTQEARSGQRLDNGQLIAVVSVLLLALSIAVGLILALNG